MTDPQEAPGALPAAEAAAPAAPAVPAEADPAELRWMLPGHAATPAESLHRIGVLCARFPDLFAALLAVLATHQGVSRELLAAAVMKYRPDLAGMSREEVCGLLVAIRNGGWQGFDAVWRAKRKEPRKAGGFPWTNKQPETDLAGLMHRRG